MRLRTETRREAIIEAAARMFEELGYENASMNELTKRLGGSKGTLYGYFPSKDELVVAVVRQFATAHMAAAAAVLQAALEGDEPLQASLLRFGDQALKVVANDARARSIHRVVVAESGRSNVGELFRDSGPRQLILLLAQLLRRQAERGAIALADPDLAAQQFMALLNAEVTGRVYALSPPDLKPAQIRQMVVRAVDFFMAAATPRVASAPTSAPTRAAARKPARAKAAGRD
jgi:AcrR family transcriptional regulator